MKRTFGGTRYANITSTLALAVALGGTGAYAANSISSRDIRNGQVKNADLASGAVTSTRVRDGSLRERDFKPGELPRGAKGDKGDRGERGLPGSAFPDALPSGQTLRGAYAFSGYYRGAGDAYDLGPADGVITFQLPLAAAPNLQLIKRKQPANEEGDPTAQCPGSVLNPQAAPGYLGVYESKISNNDGLQAFSTYDGAIDTATRFGVGLNIVGPAGPSSVHRTSKGTWAATAP